MNVIKLLVVLSARVPQAISSMERLVLVSRLRIFYVKLFFYILMNYLQISMNARWIHPCAAKSVRIEKEDLNVLVLPVILLAAVKIEVALLMVSG